MPTYTWKCGQCEAMTDVVQTIAAYSHAPFVPEHCDAPMERCITVAPGFSGLANALAGDRHYDGMRATDGADISTRSKHREYMKRNGLTTVDDFKDTWKRDAAEREARKQGHDPSRKADIIDAMQKIEAKT